MKKITNRKQKGTRTVDNVCKEGFNNNKIIAYKRNSPVGDEEYAFLTRLGKESVGYVSLIGQKYLPAYVHTSYCTAVGITANQRNLYIFKNLQDFLDNKNNM